MSGLVELCKKWGLPYESVCSCGAKAEVSAIEPNDLETEAKVHFKCLACGRVFSTDFYPIK